MSIFPRPLKKVLGKIIPFSQEDKIPTFNLGSGTADNTTFLRGDGTWASPGSSGYVPYVGATQDVNLGDYKITADAVAFDLNPVNAPAAGQIAYDGASGALAYLLNNSNVISRIGQTMHAYVHNAEAVTITKGQAVYLFSASGNKASVKLAYNTSDATSAKTFGLAAENIGAGQNGMVICQGVLDGLNTGMYTAGDTLYLGATAGTYTNVKPYAPNHFVYVGIVERANAGNGQIYVRVQNGYEMDELHDVDLITTPPVNGNVLTYNGSLWVPQSPATGITVGTTPVTSGTDGRVFFQSGGVVQQGADLVRLQNSQVRIGHLSNTNTGANFGILTVKGNVDSTTIPSNHGRYARLVLTGANYSAGTTDERSSIFEQSFNGNLHLTLNTGNFFGIGTGASPQARLDVRAQGALSTDIAFRVRNSADTANLFQVNGNGSVAIGDSGGAAYDFQVRKTTSVVARVRSTDTNSSSIYEVQNNLTNFIYLTARGSTASVLGFIQPNEAALFSNIPLNISTNSTHIALGVGSTRSIYIPSSNNVLINTTTDVASSLLTLESTTKGFLPPRMTTTQRTAIATPAAGLMVYDTTLNKHYGFDGTNWNALY